MILYGLLVLELQNKNIDFLSSCDDIFYKKQSNGKPG